MSRSVQEHGPAVGTAPGRREFLGRLGVYLLGIAIGLFMLGLLWNARARSAEAEQRASQESPPERAPTAPR